MIWLFGSCCAAHLSRDGLLKPPGRRDCRLKQHIVPLRMHRLMAAADSALVASGLPSEMWIYDKYTAVLSLVWFMWCSGDA